MTKIHQIIGSFRSRMVAAGLINLRTRGSFQPSERLASLRPSLTEMRLGLTENQERFQATQPETPLAILFYGLEQPEVQTALIEMGRAQARKVIKSLCEHGQALLAQSRSKKNWQHLEILFGDFPHYVKMFHPDQIDQIIERYSQLHFKDDAHNFIRFFLRWRNKIKELDFEDNGQISLIMEDSTSDEDLIFLGRSGKKIHKVCLWNNAEITDTGLGYLGQLPALEILDLMSCMNITDRGLATLAGLENLRELHLHGCDLIAGSGLSYLDKLTALRHIDLTGCHGLTDAGLVPLGRLKTLQVLYIGNCRQITDAGLAHLRDLTNLLVLDLNSCRQLTGSGLVHLKSLSKLKRLWLNETPINDPGLAHLIELTNLEELHLDRCVNLTDAGLVHLGCLTALKELDLQNCPEITDAGLEHLQTLPHLRKLDLLSCLKTTPAGIEKLKKAIPGLKEVIR